MSYHKLVYTISYATLCLFFYSIYTDWPHSWLSRSPIVLCLHSIRRSFHILDFALIPLIHRIIAKSQKLVKNGIMLILCFKSIINTVYYDNTLRAYVACFIGSNIYQCLESGLFSRIDFAVTLSNADFLEIWCWQISRFPNKIITRRGEFLTVYLIAQAPYSFLFLCLPDHTDTVFHPERGG